MRSEDSATETAQLIAAIVCDRNAFPKAAATELERLLGHSLAAPSPAARREARLGLLVDIVSLAEGEFITAEAYELERSRRKERGETWPAASSLSRSYGHWLRALEAACRFWHVGGAARVAAGHSHAGRSQSYRPIEIRSALLRAQAELGLAPDGWPTEGEYLEWAQISRRLARSSGNECRIPGAKPIRKAYGAYAAAVEATRRVVRGGS